MNLLITKSCNRSCPYCFAQKEVKLNASAADGNISISSFQEYLTFLQRSNIRELKLLGGEPTLHPRFLELVEIGLDRGFNVIVFSNGLWRREVRDYFYENDTLAVQFVINVNEPKYSQDSEHERLGKTLEVLGSRAKIGFNIFVLDFDLTFIQPLIETYGLQRTVRLGLASPIVGVDNRSIHAKETKAVGKRLVEQMKLLEAENILVRFDCGFTYCMFEESDWPTVVRATENGLDSTCCVIGDVDYNLDLWPCFPLSKTKHLNLRNVESFDDISKYYDDIFSPVKKLGSTEDCFLCKYLMRGQCCGGCLARGVSGILESGDKAILNKLKIES